MGILMIIVYVLVGIGAAFAIAWMVRKFKDAVALSMLKNLLSGLDLAGDLFKYIPWVGMVDRLVHYANIAVASVEQSYKEAKEEYKQMLEDGEITEEELKEFRQKLKEEAKKLVIELAKADGIELDENLLKILDGIIETAVHFINLES